MGQKGGTVRTEDSTYFCGERNENNKFGTGFLVHRRIVSAVKRVELLVTGCHIQF